MVVLAACTPRPLAPGETRCTTTHAFGVDNTNCQTGQPQPEIGSRAPTQAEVEERNERAAANEQRTTVEGDRPLICALHRAGDADGACYVNPKECEELRAAGSADDFTVCESRDAGACFNATVVLTKERKVPCAPSIRACERRLANMKADPDFEVTATKCDIYRRRSNE